MSSRSTQIIGGPDREHAWVDAATNALLVKVVNPGGASSNVNIAQVGGTNVGSTVPISDGGGSITVDGSLSASLGGLVSTGNATTTPLGANATFTGTWEQTVDYATLSVTVYADVPSATDGMKFEWSGDGVNVDEDEAITISTAHPGRAMASNVRGRYFRIRYTNGGTAQTTFRLGTVYRPSGMGANNHPLTDVFEDTTLAITTRSVIVGKTSSGGGSYENVKVTPSGALTVEINDGGGSITVDGTVAVSSVSGTVTVGDGGGSLTVDGTVAATQSGAWTVSVNEPVSVDDNGGSLTVDGTVAVSSVSGTVVVGDGGGSLTVDGTVDVSSISGTVTVSGTVSVNEPVSVDDNGGSLTVDGTVAVSSVSGTVAATQSGSWTVSVNEPVSVDDNGSSLTVDGTVTAAQATHDNLNLNATIQVGDVDVSNGNPVPVSDAGGSLTVDGTVAVSSISSTVTVSGTVSVNEPVSVDDNGGSLTVDGTVTAAQTTHDNLNLNATIQVGDVDVGNANPVPVSDAGGSLTVDGTVAATQSGSWTVSVNEPVSVDDNGGSLTVDGTVAATQSGSWTVTAAQTTHDNLNLNATIQVGDVDVGNANPVPVSDAGGSLTVDGTVAVSSVSGTVTVSGTVSVNEPVSVDDNGGSLTVDGTVTAAQATHDNLNLNANLQVNNTDVSNSNRVPISDGGGSITVDGAVAAEIFSSGTTHVLDVYRQVDAVPVKSIGLAPQCEVTDDAGAVITNLGITTGSWCHPFIDQSGGGLYVFNAGGTVSATVSSIIPGTNSGELGKAEDTAHVSGSTGVMTLAVRNDSLTVFAGPTGDYIPLSTDAAGRLQVIKSGGKATYRASTTNNVVAAASASIFFVIAGSSTKTITVQRITITCPTLTAVAYHSLIVEKFSTAPTGGTATTLTKVPLDSSSAASTANLCQVYTAAPTEGTLVGTIGCQRFLSQATTAAAAGTPPAPIVWDFRNGFGEASGVILRGTAENIGVAFGAAPASAVTVGVEVEWIEE